MSLFLSILIFISFFSTNFLYVNKFNDDLLNNIPVENRDTKVSSPLILNDNQDVYPLGLHLEILEDASGKLTINEVTSHKYANKFVPGINKVPNFGYTNSVYWVRFQMRNETSRTENWRLKLGFADMQKIDLYMKTPGSEEFVHKKTGIYLPFKTRDVPYPKFVFKIPLKYQSGKILVYMRFENGASMTLPLSLFTFDEFSRYSNNEQLLSGLFYGILFLILVYSFIMLPFIMERSYFYFIFSIASFILFHASYGGFASQYLWQEYVLPNHFAVTFFGALFVICSLKITSEYLQTKSFFPVFHKFINAWLVFWGLAVIALFVLPKILVMRGMTIFAFICPLSILLFCLVFWYKRPQRIGYFILAWIIFLVSGSITELVRLGVVTSNTFTEHGFQIGAVLLFFLLSLAFADRIRILRREKEKVDREQAGLLMDELSDGEKALQESEEKYRKVVERANDMIAIIQNDKIKFVNQKIVDILGYPLNEFKDASFNKFVHPDEYDILMKRNRQRISGEKISDTYESTLVSKKGDPINVIISGGIIDYEGKPANLAIIHDITERKKAELNLQRNEEKYRGFFKTSTDCVYFTSKDGKWLDMSDSAPGFFGYGSKEELKKVNISELYADPSDREKDLDKIEKNGVSKDVLINLKKKDGSIIKAIISSVAVKDGDGKVVAYQGSIRDITEQIETEKTLKKNQEHLKELIASKDKFFSIISHDLRSPFNAILGFTELLWKNSEQFSRKEIESIAYDMYKTGSETINLLNNLLEWSRSQTENLKMNPESFNLKSAFDETIDLLNEFAIKKNNKIMNEIPGQVEIFADKNMINSVIRNLLANARKFTQNGSVRIMAKETEKFVEFTISDTGVGIKSEDMKKLFRSDKEFTTHGTENEKGSGLGLILCKEFIEKNKGEIGIISEKNKGTSISVKLPKGKKL